MTNKEINSIVSDISYKPGWIVLFREDQKGQFIQLKVTNISDATLCSQKRDGTRIPWKSGKRYLSEFMCRQEIVGVIFDLIKSAELHEIHEWFRYKNSSIYNPHLDPDVLAEIASKKESFCVRADSMVTA